MFRPRFDLAENIATAVLDELGNPEPPIDMSQVINLLGHKVCYTHLCGPEGYTLRVYKKSGLKHIIYVATDVNGYLPDTVRRMQRWTLAHEAGHTLMHWDIPWQTTAGFDVIPAELESVLEVEAHWLASRLLMPDYAFQEPEDIIPEILAEKCDVNFTAAVKRVKHVRTEILDKLQDKTDVPLHLLRAHLAFSEGVE